jgi:alcohol dehydrogenase class IV
MIVSLGGGSSHDCAKGVGIVATNDGDIRDFAGIDTVPNPLPPFIAINTTAGTASEMTRFAVITNTDIHVKMIFATARITPTVAINDPVLMVGMPPALTAATGMDALTHAIEAYVAALANPVTDACALAAIRLVNEYLPQAVANGDNLEARDKMAYAEYLAGMAFNNAGIGIETHLSYDITKQWYMSLDYFYNYGGETEIAGVKQKDELSNHGLGVSLFWMVGSNNQLMIEYRNDFSVKSGAGTDTFGARWAYFF